MKQKEVAGAAGAVVRSAVAVHVASRWRPSFFR
jgi:hypothetical protein